METPSVLEVEPSLLAASAMVATLLAKVARVDVGLFLLIL